jgi:membrane-associated protease RseP (regulator of RpoE activity)
MNRIAIAVVVSLIAGFAVGAWVGGDDSEGVTTLPVDGGGILDSEASTEDRLLRLERIIAEERDARIALEDTIAMLFEGIESLEGAGDRAVAELKARAERDNAARANTRRVRGDEADWIRDYQERRVTRMVESGFSEDEARRVLEQESLAAFKALESAWEAQRSGETIDRYSSEYNPQAIMRSELGDDTYARYLESQGQPTAISITQVLGGSPGSKIGLQPGDQLISYAGDRVFSVTELRNQSMQGNPGEDIVIEIERNGTRMQLTLPRGPIGITGSGANLRGANWWGG